MLHDAIYDRVRLDQYGRVIDARRLRDEIMARYSIGHTRADAAISRVARAKRTGVKYPEPELD